MPPRDTRPKGQLTHCRNGHEYTDDNTVWHPEGTKSCRVCRRAAMQRRREIEKERNQVATPHDHQLDGQLHDGCPACELIRERKLRDPAHTEVKNDLARISEKAQLRYHPPKKDKDQ